MQAPKKIRIGTPTTPYCSIDSVLYKHLNHETTEAEERRLYAWLEERRSTAPSISRSPRLERPQTLSSKQLGERCDAMMRRLNARGSTPTKRAPRGEAAASRMAPLGVGCGRSGGGRRRRNRGVVCRRRYAGDELFRTYLNESGEIAALRRRRHAGVDAGRDRTAICGRRGFGGAYRAHRRRSLLRGGARRSASLRGEDRKPVGAGAGHGVQRQGACRRSADRSGARTRFGAPADPEGYNLVRLIPTSGPCSTPRRTTSRWKRSTPSIS